MDDIIQICTNRSKNQEAVSVESAVWNPHSSKEITKSLPKASIFIAKAWSIRQALDEVKSWHDDRRVNVLICTDSMSVLQAVLDTKQSAHKHVFIVDI